MQYGYDAAVFSSTTPAPHLAFFGGDRLVSTRDNWEGRQKVSWGRVQAGVQSRGQPPAGGASWGRAAMGEGAAVGCSSVGSARARRARRRARLVAAAVTLPGLLIPHLALWAQQAGWVQQVPHAYRAGPVRGLRAARLGMRGAPAEPSPPDVPRVQGDRPAGSMPVGAPEGALVEPKGEQAGLESANREAQNALFSLPSKAWSIANSSLHDRPRAGLGLWGLGLCRCLPAAAAARRRHSCCPSSAAAPLLLLPPQPIPAPPHPAATAAPSSLCSLRKTGGKITGDIRVNGFPQQPATFNRVMG